SRRASSWSRASGPTAISRPASASMPSPRPILAGPTAAQFSTTPRSGLGGINRRSLASPLTTSPPGRGEENKKNEQYVSSGVESQYLAEPAGSAAGARARAGDWQREGRVGQIDDGAAHRRGADGRWRTRGDARSRRAPGHAQPLRGESDHL